MTTQDNGDADAGQAGSGRRLIQVSNRLPVVLQRDEAGAWASKPAVGGLVAALDPVMQRRGGLWVGWSGVAETDTADLRHALDDLNARLAYRLEPVALSTDEIKGFYEGFSNEIIWPLFHNQFTACQFDPDYWRVYSRVNRKFAHTLTELVRTGDFIWVHDYHLINLAAELRGKGVSNRIGFFQHIPFPSLDIFRNLPWWREVIHSLLAYDFIGFQTPHDRDNFLNCVAAEFDEVQVTGDGDNRRVEITHADLPNGNRYLKVGALPVGIDYQAIAQAASSEEAERFFQTYRKSWTARQIALGVDRLDYTKGLPHKLEAFRNALARYPELRSRLSLVQHVVPSREQVREYADQKMQIERMVGEINGEFTEPGWVPIHYLFRSMSRAELMAYYRVADIALVTPLRDGMNLVSKEYCAANVSEDGVLILSEFAGSAAQLEQYALMVNPHDVEGMADRIYEAYCMAVEERRRRMRAMREIVSGLDAFDWVDRFLQAAGYSQDQPKAATG